MRIRVEKIEAETEVLNNETYTWNYRVTMVLGNDSWTLMRFRDEEAANNSLFAMQTILNVLNHEKLLKI